MARFVVKGEPRKEIFVNVAAVNYGQILNGKNILITGGSSGIGLAIAKKCVKEGALVLITGRNEDKLKAAREEIGQDKCRTLQFDMSEVDTFDGKIQKALTLLDEKIDILVNNSGIGWWKDYWEYNEDDFEQMIHTNLRGVYFLTQKLSRIWVNEKINGNILMIASEAGIIGDFAPYGISKSAVIHLTKGLAKKMSIHDIRINAIAPGVTVTPISKDNSQYDPKGDLFRSNNCGQRALLPEEIAEVAVFLLSDASRCINGEIIACNLGNALA